MEFELVLIILLSIISTASIAFAFFMKKKEGTVPQDMSFAVLMREVELAIPEFMALYGVIKDEDVSDEIKATEVASKFYKFFVENYLAKLADEDPNIFGGVYSLAMVIPEDKLVKFIASKFMYLFKK